LQRLASICDEVCEGAHLGLCRVLPSTMPSYRQEFIVSFEAARSKDVMCCSSFKHSTSVYLHRVQVGCCPPASCRGTWPPLTLHGKTTGGDSGHYIINHSSHLAFKCCKSGIGLENKFCLKNKIGYCPSTLRAVLFSARRELHTPIC
jgi:hypothetical protein